MMGQMTTRRFHGGGNVQTCLEVNVQKLYSKSAFVHLAWDILPSAVLKVFGALRPNLCMHLCQSGIEHVI